MALLRYSQVAAEMGISVRTVRQLVVLRLLPVVRPSPRTVRIASTDVAAYVAARTVPARSPAPSPRQGRDGRRA